MKDTHYTVQGQIAEDHHIPKASLAYLASFAFYSSFTFISLTRVHSSVEYAFDPSAVGVTSSLALAAAGTTEPESAEHVPSHQTSINHSGSFHLLEKDPDENHVAFD